MSICGVRIRVTQKDRIRNTDLYAKNQDKGKNILCSELVFYDLKIVPDVIVHLLYQLRICTKQKLNIYNPQPLSHKTLHF